MSIFYIMVDKEVTHDLPFISKIVDIHVLTTGILSATILFLLLRYNKNFDKPRLKFIITTISILFCFLAIIISGSAVLISMNNHDKTISKKVNSKKDTILDRIIDKLPFIVSIILLIISLLLFYTVSITSIRLFFKNVGI